ncbi:MAG: hypothetical protein KC561_13600, partial [Myxococcales bacterium]|nr:hypothetical protein [Myxococcales bacterium]
ALPSTPTEITVAYAERFPAETQAIFVGRGFDGVKRVIEGLKSVIPAELFQVAFFEAEVRNTFGLDVNRPVTFREAGIYYDGGFALGDVMQQPVFAVMLLDPEVFAAKVRDVLRANPFNMRARVETVEAGDATVELYRAREGDEPDLALVIDGTMGYLISRTTTSRSLSEVALALVGVEAGNSLSTNQAFGEVLAKFDEFPGFLYINSREALSYYRQRFDDQMSNPTKFIFDHVAAAVTGVGAGFRWDGQSIVAHGFVRVSDEVLAIAQGIDQPEGENPHFERAIGEGSYLALRLSLNPRVLWSTAMAFQGMPTTLPGAEAPEYHVPEDAAERVAADVQDALRFLGDEAVEELNSVLTGQVAVTLNRLSFLTLVQASDLTDYADGTWATLAFQVRDREAAIRLLDRTVQAYPDRLSRQDEGDVARYVVRDQSLNYGDIAVIQDLIVVGSDRRLRTIIRRAGESELNPLESPNPLVADVVTGTRGAGGFLTFSQLAPLANIPAVPRIARDILEILGSAAFTAEMRDDGVYIRGRLELNPAPQE